MEKNYNYPTRSDFQDLTGQSFGRLTVKSWAYKVRTNSHWNCVCVCGNQTVVAGGKLKLGDSTSCGCYNKEVIGNMARKHGLDDHPLMARCRGMISRCHNPDEDCFERYGGRGIQVHKPWRENLSLMVKDIEAEIGLPPFDGAQIDRIKNGKGYEPFNIQWTDREGNMRNTRVSHGHGVDQNTRKRSKTYKAWQTMVYNNRGDVTSDWVFDKNPDTTNGFKQFLSDMGEKRGMLKRFDDSKPFSKENCYWK